MSDEATARAKVKEFREMLLTLMRSGDEEGLEKVLGIAERSLTRLGLDQSEIEFIKCSILCASAPEKERVRMHNGLAQSLGMAYLFQSNPPTIDVYREGGEVETITGEVAAHVFEGGQKLAARVDCSHHDAMRSLLMGYVIRKYLDRIRDDMKARGITIPSINP